MKIDEYPTAGQYWYDYTPGWIELDSVSEATGHVAGPNARTKKILIISKRVDEASGLLFKLNLGGRNVTITLVGVRPRDPTHDWMSRVTMGFISTRGARSEDEYLRVRLLDAEIQIPTQTY